MSPPLLAVDDLVREYMLPRASIFSAARRLRVLHGVSIRLEAGETLGVVGESGCGKSTLARAVMALEKPQAGKVRILGKDPFALERARLRELRRHFQAIFQDPYGSLDPRHTVARIVAEPIASLEAEASSTERRRRVAEALAAVGLGESALDKYPHEFSGGQRQRIAIARALVTHPALIVADEPVSALDVSVQAQVLNLMMDLQEKMGLAYLFISHDLGVIRAIADRVAVMYLGRIVEEGATARVFDQPRHPYTRMLVDAVPRPGAGRRRGGDAGGAPPTPAQAGEGCAFAPRCPRAEARCRVERPELAAVDHGGRAACHFA
ncbi:MAG: ATP-binding cassette domain-containing protein [Methylobacteriaceae bacterium]|nr:ATP-binding cassette domain-containing protein [Methylobacteriaceae bacterium]